MKLISGIVFLLFWGRASAQEMIGLERAGVRTALEQSVAVRDTVNRKLAVSDSTLTVTVMDLAGKTLLSTIYTFNKKGICYQEKVSAACAACLSPWLQEVLAKTNFGWKKINEHQYISAFEKKMFLELPPEGEQTSFMIFRVDWNKEMYEILRGSQVNQQ